MRVWDVRRRALDAVLEGHTDDVYALAVLPGGELLSGSGDTTIRVWDARALSVRGGGATAACAATLEGHANGVMALAVLRDGSVVSGCWDGTVRVWV